MNNFKRLFLATLACCSFSAFIAPTASAAVTQINSASQGINQSQFMASGGSGSAGVMFQGQGLSQSGSIINSGSNSVLVASQQITQLQSLSFSSSSSTTVINIPPRQVDTCYSYGNSCHSYGFNNFSSPSYFTYYLPTYRPSMQDCTYDEGYDWGFGLIFEIILSADFQDDTWGSCIYRCNAPTPAPTPTPTCQPLWGAYDLQCAHIPTPTPTPQPQPITCPEVPQVLCSTGSQYSIENYIYTSGGRSITCQRPTCRTTPNPAPTPVEGNACTSTQRCANGAFIPGRWTRWSTTTGDQLVCTQVVGFCRESRPPVPGRTNTNATATRPWWNNFGNFFGNGGSTNPNVTTNGQGTPITNTNTPSVTGSGNSTNTASPVNTSNPANTNTIAANPTNTNTASPTNTITINPQPINITFTPNITVSPTQSPAATNSPVTTNSQGAPVATATTGPSTSSTGAVTNGPATATSSSGSPVATVTTTPAV